MLSFTESATFAQTNSTLKIHHSKFNTIITLHPHISLKPYNTFGVDVRSEWFGVLQNKADILELTGKRFEGREQVLILGEGSNILLCGDFDGLALRNEIKGIEVIKENEHHVWVRSLSGTIWHELVSFCVGRNYGGIENLSLIPGTVGAAPMQNIGAYGVELKDTFEELEAIDLQSGEIKVFDKEACAFGYRQSVFKGKEKGKYFIYSVTFRLSKHPVPNTDYGDIRKVLEQKGITHPTIKEVSEAVIAIRQSKLPDPKHIGNAGSFFKNPEVSHALAAQLKNDNPDMPAYELPGGLVKIPAAWLIEQCGWKGRQVGHTGNHAKQALVIVNYGNATGNEIRAHALNVQRSVQEKFGILLEAEVNMIG